MNLAIVVGTRPEIIRLSATIKLARKLFNVTLIHTGQNYDYNLNEIFFKELDIKNPEIYLNCSNANPGEIVGDIINKTYNIFKEKKFDALLILGDTNSCLCTYSAKRLKIPIFHLEAGNRCFDLNVPEEINRKIIDHISDVNICYMEHAKINLLNEGIKQQYIFVCGSPMTEIINNVKDSMNSSNILEKYNLKINDYFVLSIHREENIDSDENLIKIINSINNIGLLYNKKIIFSCHPRTKKKLVNIKLNENIILSQPFGFIDYLKLQKNSMCVISDSGTLSEESTILQFKSILLRTSTEHPETIDAGNIIIGNIEWNQLNKCIEIVMDNNFKINNVKYYDNDNFSEKICKIIIGYYKIINKFNWMK